MIEGIEVDKEGHEKYQDDKGLYLSFILHMIDHHKEDDKILEDLQVKKESRSNAHISHHHAQKGSEERGRHKQGNGGIKGGEAKDSKFLVYGGPDKPRNNDDDQQKIIHPEGNLPGSRLPEKHLR